LDSTFSARASASFDKSELHEFGQALTRTLDCLIGPKNFQKNFRRAPQKRKRRPWGMYA
jgi:hypothetical protein